MTENHYFATFALGYARGTTREEAIEKLVNAFRSDFREITKNSQKNGLPGAYVYSCEVLAPIDAEYGIQFYQPLNVTITSGQEHYVTYVTNKKVARFDLTVEVQNQVDRQEKRDKKHAA